MVLICKEKGLIEAGNTLQRGLGCGSMLVPQLRIDA